MEIEEIKSKIGEKTFAEIEKIADDQVGKAMSMPLIDQWNKDNYYSLSFDRNYFQHSFSALHEAGMRINPIEIFLILFRAKLLFSSKHEDEYEKRNGQSSFNNEDPLSILWKERVKNDYDEIVNIHLKMLCDSVSKRTLCSKMSHIDFIADSTQEQADSFFEKISKDLYGGFLYSLFSNSSLAAHVAKERDYDKHKNSLAYSTDGSYGYSYYYNSAQLRTLFNLLKVSGFIYRGQIDHGYIVEQMAAPTHPIFIGDNSIGGVFDWDNESRKPWLKTPDGVMFCSFGNKSISKYFMRKQTYDGAEKFLNENGNIIKSIQNNPWSIHNIQYTEPTLDLLSAATQITNMGAKILLLYCALEHMFVPRGQSNDNKKYIIGGIGALNPSMIDWFDRLYKLRCDYAHKGYVKSDEHLMFILETSMENICNLLDKKLSLSLS